MYWFTALASGQLYLLRTILMFLVFSSSNRLKKTGTRRAAESEETNAQTPVRRRGGFELPHHLPFRSIQPRMRGGEAIELNLADL